MAKINIDQYNIELLSVFVIAIDSNIGVSCKI